MALSLFPPCHENIIMHYDNGWQNIPFSVRNMSKDVCQTLYVCLSVRSSVIGYRSLNHFNFNFSFFRKLCDFRYFFWQNIKKYAKITLFPEKVENTLVHWSLTQNENRTYLRAPNFAQRFAYGLLHSPLTEEMSLTYPPLDTLLTITTYSHMLQWNKVNKHV